MSLVTRCTTCGTVFRVVQDQLKVSSGWVRCGRCGEVFNALQTLFDLERDGPVVAAPAASASPAAVPPSGLRPSAFAGLTEEPFPDPESDRRVLRGASPAAYPSPTDDNPRTAQRTEPVGPSPSEPPLEWSAPPSADKPDDAPVFIFRTERTGETQTHGQGEDLVDDAIDSSRPAGSDGGSIWPTDSRPARWIEPPLDAAPGGSAASDSRQMVVVDAGPDLDDAPAFLREDDRRRRAASPVVRGLLGFAALSLAALLVGQWALHERDRTADLWPWSRPLLQQACRVGGCELLEAPRRLDAFTVESTTLTRAAAGAAAYRLSITLRNRSPRAATLPSVELALTDTDGQLVARRALHPADFRIQRPIVPGGADTTLQLLMTTPKDRVNGYTIEIFYP